MTDEELKYHTAQAISKLEEEKKEIEKWVVESARMADAPKITSGIGNYTDSKTTWMPIETAPHDQDVMVWNEVTGAYRTRASRVADFDETQWPMTFWNQAGTWWPQPSHWMPMDKLSPNGKGKHE